MNINYLGKDITDPFCKKCCNQDFCKSCILYKDFPWFSSCNQDQSRSTGVSKEDSEKLNHALFEITNEKIYFFNKNYPKGKPVIIEGKGSNIYSPEPPADNQWPEVQEYLTKVNEGEIPENFEIEKRISAALKRSKSQSNYQEVENKYGKFEKLSVKVSEEFSAAKRYKGKADSKHKNRRFGCPDCNKERINKAMNVTFRKIEKEYPDLSIEELGLKYVQELVKDLETSEFSMIEQNQISNDSTGHCPLCGRRIYPNKSKTGGVFDNGKRSDEVLSIPAKGSVLYCPGFNPFYDEYNVEFGPVTKLKESIIGEVNGVTIHGDLEEVELLGQKYDLKFNKEKEEAFHSQYDVSSKMNFTGHANKKSCGRSPNGWLDINAEKHGKDKHGVSFTINPNYITIPTGKFVKVNGVQKEIYKVKKFNACKCGCNVRLNDSRRSETVCPKCGEVFSRRGIDRTEPKKTIMTDVIRRDENHNKYRGWKYYSNL